ncbi:MAG: hypothetical protein JJV98_11675 [Desulfosarcina sp.]|nr:hypothetical protein [Desulfobacterales bacterium]
MRKRVLQRFLHYITVDTHSDPDLAIEMEWNPVMAWHKSTEVVLPLGRPWTEGSLSGCPGDTIQPGAK